MRETTTPPPTARNGNAVQTKGEAMKITALYERLSSGDDGRNGDSNSIKKVIFVLGSHLSKPTYLK